MTPDQPNEPKRVTAEEGYFRLMPTKYPGYLASDDGRVYTLKNRKKWLKPQLMHNGYYRVCIRFNRKKFYRYVHCLVAEAFFGGKPNGMQVNHKDCNKLNNQLENLEYVTLRQNLEHAWRNGLKCAGEKHGAAKLSDGDITTILERFRSGERCSAIARDYFVNIGTIQRVAYGHSWNIRALKTGDK